MPLARVLIVAGSDSGGGAGIQADIKTVTALGAYAATAITALTAQDTLGVHGVHAVPAAFVADQMRCVLNDIGADAIKTGMLGDQALIETVAAMLDATFRACGDLPLVVDPVMVAKGGARLLPDDAVACLRRRLIPLAAVLTPNLPEAEILCGGRPIADPAAMRDACSRLLDMGAHAVLLKGGHLPARHSEGTAVIDMLATQAGIEEMASDRIDTRHTHGTGCTLASAVATGLAQGMTLRDTILRARDYVRAAILAAPGLGTGHGPLNHLVACGPDGRFA